MTILAGKRIVLGVTGSIAAYKAAELASQLVKTGADLHVILTRAAQQFVGAAAFRALTQNPVTADVFDEPFPRQIAHIHLAQSVDLLLVAPASANTLAAMAQGRADEMLTAVYLATPPSTPVLVAPAMNTVMWEHPATRENLATLRRRGVEVIEPVAGMLACRTEGAGKLEDVPEIVAAVVRRLTRRKDLVSKRVLVTAGPTREPLDPVRFLTNRSSGKMGYAVAAAARDRGATVTLVAGPTALPDPPGIETVRVETADEMLSAAGRAFDACDLLIAAAAVADYRPQEAAGEKIKKGEPGEALALRLVQNPDIVATLAARKRPGQVVVGFAAETGDLLANAAAKLAKKRLDLIAANDVAAPGIGFDSDDNAVTLLFADGRREEVSGTKREVADALLDRALTLLPD